MNTKFLELQTEIRTKMAELRAARAAVKKLQKEIVTAVCTATGEEYWTDYQGGVNIISKHATPGSKATWKKIDAVMAQYGLVPHPYMQDEYHRQYITPCDLHLHVTS